MNLKSKLQEKFKKVNITDTFAKAGKDMILGQFYNEVLRRVTAAIKKGEPVVTDQEIEKDLNEDWQQWGGMYKMTGVTLEDLINISKKAVADASAGGAAPELPKVVDFMVKKIGRNAPCPCGSGKKYKNCCGKGQ